MAEYLNIDVGSIGFALAGALTLSYLAYKYFANNDIRYPGIITKFKAYVGYYALQGLPIRIPETVEGKGSSSEMASVVKKQKVNKPFIVTDEMIVKLGLVDKTLSSLKAAGIEYVLWDKVLPDPSIHLAKEGLDLYLQNGCDGIIAVGGGSPMDCAKLIGALTTDLNKTAADFMGFFKVWGKFPPLIAVPTTAGTGSETTVASVISFPEEQKKKYMVDPRVVPRVAVLDPEILEKLPAHITAATGMDALTHAVESYIGKWRNDFTAGYSLNAVKDTYKYLPTCVENGSDPEARKKMLRASFDAGVAFTRANVGYVHAIAHQLGGIFHTPHGVANAMLLPHVLAYYRDACTESFADLAVAAGLGKENDDKETLADKFVQSVFDMNEKLSMPNTVRGMKEEDIPEVARRALAEAHGWAYDYKTSPVTFLLDTGMPVPKYMCQQDVEGILKKLLA